LLSRSPLIIRRTALIAIRKSFCYLLPRRFQCFRIMHIF
ncbi:hypothetical protein T4D_7081, partial [Trichinella pseudospiralis]